MTQLPPWLQRRDGEDDDAWFARKARSCWYCPIEPFPDFLMADNHEVECANTPRKKRLQYKPASEEWGSHE